MSLLSAPAKVRDPAAKTELKLRLPEPLRADLEASAKRNGVSMNYEMVHRLQGSVRDDQLGAILFGDTEMYAVMDTLARTIRAVELTTGKPWSKDLTTYVRAVETIYRFLKAAPAAIATGNYPGGIRDMADIGALAMIEKIIGTQDEMAADKKGEEEAAA